jgi:hypothetical protein
MKLKSGCNGKVVQSLSDRNPELKRGSWGVEIEKWVCKGKVIPVLGDRDRDRDMKLKRECSVKMKCCREKKLCRKAPSLPEKWDYI